MKNNLSLRRMILLPTFSIVIVILIIFTLFASWITSDIIDSLLVREINTIVTTLHQKMTEQAWFFKNQMVMLAKDSSLRSYFLAGDRAALLHDSSQIMETLRENYITHFYFHTLDRTTFLRVHNPDNYGDRNDRSTILQAENQTAFAFGTEIGKTGTLTLRGVLPWFAGEKLIGYLELGKEIEHFINDIQRNLNIRLYTFCHKKYFDQATFKNASAIFDKNVDWTSFSELLFIGPQGTTYPTILQEYVAAGQWRMEDPLLSMSHNRSKELMLFSIPIRDTQNNIVCRVIGISELFKYKKLILFHDYILGMIALGLMIFFGWFFYRHLVKMEDKLNMMAVSMGKLNDEIAEREKIQWILQQERNLFNLILSSTDKGIYGIDKVGHCIFINRAGLELLGYDNENDIIGEKIHQLIHHTRTNGTPFPVQECQIHNAPLMGRSILIDDEVFWRRDGTFFPVEYSAHPINVEEHNIIGALVVFHDITQRQRDQEKELYLSFQSGVAEMSVSLLHNIGNAIMSISHRAELLSNKSQYLVETGQVIVNLGDFARQQLTHGKTATQVLSSLVTALEDTGREFLRIAQEDFLKTTTQIKTGVEHIANIVSIHKTSANVTIDKQEFNFLKLIEDAFAIQEVMLKKYAITTKIKVINPFGIVALPRTRTLQLMINFVKNSIDAIVEQKKYEACDGVITIMINKVMDSLEIAIIDNGCGIPQEKLSDIFNYGVTTKRDGTGIGLHSAALFLKSLGGSIEAQSNGSGSGATFLLKIPAAFNHEAQHVKQ